MNIKISCPVCGEFEVPKTQHNWMKLYNQIIADINQVLKEVKVSSSECDTLEEKIKKQRLYKELGNAGLIIKKLYYEFEDAVK